MAVLFALPKFPMVLRVSIYERCHCATFLKPIDKTDKNIITSLQYTTFYFCIIYNFYDLIIWKDKSLERRQLWFMVITVSCIPVVSFFTQRLFLNQLALENYCVNHFHLLFCLKHIKKANKKTQEVFLKATALPQSKLYFVTTVFLKKERPSAIYTNVSLLLKTITVIVLYNKITN